jgi:hypothetical protein
MPNSEKRKELTKQIIIRVKEVIEDLSDAEVVRRMEEAGEQTSLSTVRRVRAEGSEDASFNYSLTVRPFAKVFLGLSNAPVEVNETDSEEVKDRAALDNMIQLKNLEMEALKKEIEAGEKRFSEYKTETQLKIDHLKKQIEKQDKIIEDRKEFMAERRDFILRLEDEKKGLRRLCVILGLLLAVCVLVIISALIIDLINPNIGFFWLDDVARIFNGSGLAESSGAANWLNI